MVTSISKSDQSGRMVKAQGWNTEGSGFEPSHRNYSHTWPPANE